MTTTYANYSTRELQVIRDALDNELAARQQQLAILTATLEQLVNAGASDAAVEHIMQAIDVIDAAALSASDTSTPADPVEDESGHEAEPPADTRKQVMQHLRALGYNAPGIDALIRLYHRDLAEQEWAKAETDTRGQMLNPTHRASGYSTRNLWFCNQRELRKYASDELLEWFDRHGRLTYAMLRDRLLTGNHHAGIDGGYHNNR